MRLNENLITKVEIANKSQYGPKAKQQWASERKGKAHKNTNYYCHNKSLMYLISNLHLESPNKILDELVDCPLSPDYHVRLSNGRWYPTTRPSRCSFV